MTPWRGDSGYRIQICRFFPICTLSILQGSTGPRIDHKSWWSLDGLAGNPLSDLDVDR
jgi:hypothetical protein